MSFIDSALSAAISSGAFTNSTFTSVNKNHNFSLVPPSAQGDKENIRPPHPSGQAEQAQDDEFEEQFFQSPSETRSTFNEQLKEVGLFGDVSPNHVNPEYLKNSIEADDDTTEMACLEEPEYIYKAIINEAKQLAKDEQPEFCVMHRPKGSLQKTVFHADTDEEVVMQFKNLCPDLRYGY